MGVIVKYVHTVSTNKAEMQKYLDDAANAAASLYETAGFDIFDVDGIKQVAGKINGVSKPDNQRTTAFDIAHPKDGTDGFYCANVADLYNEGNWITNLPDFNDYTGLIEINDVSQWKNQ